MIAIKDVCTSCSIDHWFPTNHAPMSASLSGQSWAVTTLTWVTAWSIISLHLIYSSICSCSWCPCASLEGPGVYKFNSHVYNYALQKNYHQGIYRLIFYCQTSCYYLFIFLLFFLSFFNQKCPRHFQCLSSLVSVL